MLQQYLPFTVLKQSFSLLYHYFTLSRVATVPTVYGIETSPSTSDQPHHYYKLQQYLPFTVLKRSEIIGSPTISQM